MQAARAERPGDAAQPQQPRTLVGVRQSRVSVVQRSDVQVRARWRSALPLVGRQRLRLGAMSGWMEDLLDHPASPQERGGSIDSRRSETAIAERADAVTAAVELPSTAVMFTDKAVTAFGDTLAGYGAGGTPGRVRALARRRRANPDGVSGRLPAVQPDVPERTCRALPCRVLPPRSDDHGQCRSERTPTKPLAEAAPAPSPRKLDAGRRTPTCSRTCAPIPADSLQDLCCFTVDSDSTGLLPKQTVEGSNPFPRSKSLPQDNSGPALAP